MLRLVTFNKISRLDLELRRSNGAIVGNFRIGVEDTKASRIRIAIAVIGFLMTLPAAVGLAAGALKQFLGVTALYDSMMTWNIELMKGSLFIGAPFLLIVGVIAVTRIGFTRTQDGIKTFIAVHANPFILFAIAMAFAVAAIFYGHLLADAWACMRGISSSC